MKNGHNFQELYMLVERAAQTAQSRAIGIISGGGLPFVGFVRFDQRRTVWALSLSAMPSFRPNRAIDRSDRFGVLLWARRPAVRPNFITGILRIMVYLNG